MKEPIKDFSIIVLPDTQNVSTQHPDKLVNMAQWIVDHSEELNIKMVLHVGDLVNLGAEDESHWENHRVAFNLIDQADIPMIIAIGNHDYDNNLLVNRNSDSFNKHCGLHRYKGKSWFGGTFEEGKTENMFAKLEMEGRKFIFLSLEFGPRNEVIDWANKILQDNSDHDATIVTHSYMYLNGERTKPGDNHNPKDYKGACGANDGADLWEKCIKRHKNIVSVYSGHHIHDSVSYRFDLGDHQNVVFQSFQNWQSTDSGGEGRMRLLKYQLQDNRVDLQVMNPQHDLFETEKGYEVSFPIDIEEKDFAKWLSVKHP